MFFITGLIGSVAGTFLARRVGMDRLQRGIAAIVLLLIGFVLALSVPLIGSLVVGGGVGLGISLFYKDKSRPYREGSSEDKG